MPELSIIICTRNRAGSLAITLECLGRNDRAGVDFEVIIVDNGSSDNTLQTVDAFRDCLPIRYLFEPNLGTYGKSHALNRGINAGRLGEVVAILDDDMSPETGWISGVDHICRRWPDKDLFTGRTYVIWPVMTVPGWALEPRLRGWIFSAADYGDRDVTLSEGRWFSGNHFWFRSRVLQGGLRFKDIWLTEPDFMLQLAEEGYEGLAGPDAVAGHRVQPRLLEREVARELAAKVGRCYAAVRLQPYKRNVKQSRLFKSHPLASRLFCFANGIRWRFLYFVSKLHPSPDEKFVRSLVAIERSATYQELLHTARQMDEYRIWPRN